MTASTEAFDFGTARKAILRSTLPIHARMIMLVLVEHMPTAFPSVKRLAEQGAMSARQAMREIQCLEYMGVIAVNRSAGRSSYYRFVCDWTDRLQAPYPSQLTTPVTSDTQSPVTPSHTTHDSQSRVPVTPSHPKQESLSSNSKQEYSASKSPRRKSSSSSSSKAKPKKAEKPKPEAKPPVAGAHELKLHYEAEFLATREAKPEFGKRWSRAMKAFGELATTHGLEKAKTICSTALRDEYARRINPWEILDDAVKYLGKRPGPARSRVTAQQGTYEGFVANDAPAWLTGGKKEKYGPGGGNGPQPNDPRHRFVPHVQGETEAQYQARCVAAGWTE